MSEHEHGYVIIARMNLDTGVRYVDSMLDVSEYMGFDLEAWATKERVKAKMLGNKPVALDDVSNKLRAIPMMELRARFNMADGPLLIKACTPLGWDELDAYVANLSNEAYAKFVKEAKI